MSTEQPKKETEEESTTNTPTTTTATNDECQSQAQGQPPSAISSTVQNIPRMPPMDPNNPNFRPAPPPHGQPMMVRMHPIHPPPRFIIPHHPHPHQRPFSQPHPPNNQQQPPQQQQQQRQHPPPFPAGHHPHLFNARYASGMTQIPVHRIPVHGMPQNVVLTPIHPPPPGHNVTFIRPQNFNVPPVQTIYTQNNQNNNQPKEEPNGRRALSNIRKHELLPINPQNHLYANSQQMAHSNPHQMVPPHVRSQLIQSNANHNKACTNINGNGASGVATVNQPNHVPFDYAHYQAQTKRIQTWNEKKNAQEAKLKQIAAEHGHSSDSDIGIPRNINGHNNQMDAHAATGRAHFVPQNNVNGQRYYDPNANAQQYGYDHVGYDPQRYDTNNDRKRKRDEIRYSETDEDLDYDMNHLYDDTTTETSEDDNIGPPKKKKRKTSKGNKGKMMSKSERKRQYEHYMKQFEGIEAQLDNLKPIEPMEDFKKTRKEYIKNLIVEKILHRREYENPDTGLPQYEYYVLFKYLSYIHCEWISEEQLLSEKKGSTKKKRYDKQNYPNWIEGVELFDASYTTVDRILSARPGPGFNAGDTRFEYFVKFNALNYSDCRWEFADDIDDDIKIQQFQKRSLMRSDAWDPKIRPRPNFYKPLLSEDNKFKDGNTLHPWQIEGTNWLTFNWYNRRGGILADEMGLGKTVQVVSTLAGIANIYAPGPFLVVAPLSTVNHWKREIEAWTDLNAVIYQGNKEDRRICHFFEFRFFDATGRRLVHSDLYKFDVLITTYESVMLDDELQRIHWRVAVIDEAHRLKNNASKLSVHLRKCNIEHSILLTGTPIQNNMKELWNLLNFVDAKQFVAYEQFEQQYGDDKMKTDEQVSDLKMLIKPYFLRRLKEDVAKFIPEKKETIIEVELTRIQKTYYRAMLEKNREFLYRGVSTRNAPKLMNIANDLRKICNHPYLISGAYERITNGLTKMEDKVEKMIASSGKFILLNKLLPKLKDDGSKVLIFSQWRITLDWIEEYLRRKVYPYERIDGNITGNSRQAAIDRFCSPNSNSFIFLLTTKAGGVGLNLTAADTVVIFDSDWNPQNDIQAMARCHRIGQSKAVKVYRLITSRSYEKEMFIKASKKLGLGQAIMGSVEDQQLLSQTDVNKLLKHGAYNLFQDDDKECDQFCAENIEEILSKRSTDIIFDSKSKSGSAFSRATFISSDDAANIDLDDKDFWEKILPKELNPSDMIEALENDENALINDEEKRNEFWTNLTSQVEEVRDLRERGMLASQIQTIIKLLTIVANKPNIFSDEQRIKAQDWANYIENPRRFKRNRDQSRAFNEDDLFLPSTSRHSRVAERQTTVYKTEEFTPKEVENLSRIFFDTFATATDNIFEIVHAQFCKLMLQMDEKDQHNRSLREVSGWCNAFILYLSTELHDQRDKNVFVDIKHMIKKLMPKKFGDADDIGSGDEDYVAPKKKKKDKNKDKKEKHKKNKKKLPKKCEITDFPSFDEKWFARIINKSSTQWAKRMRLAILLRQRLKSVRNIENIRIPDHIGGDLPTSWWTSVDDKNLLIGSATFGVCKWEEIRKHAPFGFIKKMLLPNANNNNNGGSGGMPSMRIPKMTADNNVQKDESHRKCCGVNKPSEIDVQCDQCEDFVHGKCVGIYAPEQMPGIWFCFECNGSWPKSNTLYDRLAAILHAMKKHRYSSGGPKKTTKIRKVGSKKIKKDKKDKSAKDAPVKKSRKSQKAKLTNSRTRIGRMWNFSLKEMHALQRTVQIYGKIDWEIMKTKSKSPKTGEQVKSYFYSFMSNVEYLIRCERLKELIVSGKIELPLALQQKFCRPSEVKKRGGFGAMQRMPMHSAMPLMTQTPESAIPPSLTPPVVGPSHSAIPPPPAMPPLDGLDDGANTNTNSNVIKYEQKYDPNDMNMDDIDDEDDDEALPDLIKGACLSMVTTILNDHVIMKRFASFKAASQSPAGQALDDSLTLSDIYRKIELDQYTNPKQIFAHIQSMIDHKLTKHPNDEEIIKCVNNINRVVQQNKSRILTNFAANKRNQSGIIHHVKSEFGMGMHMGGGMDIDGSGLLSNPQQGHVHNPMHPNPMLYGSMVPLRPHINFNRFKIKKTDMDMLSENDVEKYFGLRKPDSIVNHQLTVNLANKVWQRAAMWVHLRKVQGIDPSTLSKLYSIVKAQRNEPGTISKLPEWWYPPKHDRLIVKMILKHGMQQTPELFVNDEEFKKEIVNEEHIEFLRKFFVPKKPLIMRLRYVAYVLTSGGEEPTRDTWHYNNLSEIQGPFYYKPVQSREDYQRAMNEWFEENEITAADDQSPAPSSSIDRGLLSSKSPRRTGKSSELIERYRTLQRDEEGDLIFPIQAKQGASIISLGDVVFDRKLFSSSKYIWPNGFESQRVHPSYLEPSQRVIYTSKIVDAGDRPKFAVIASDDPDNPIIANSASTAWTNVITKVNYAKDPDKRRKTCTVSGPEMFGYNDPLIIALIEELPNSEKVIKYWKNRTPFKEVLYDAFAA